MLLGDRFQEESPDPHDRRDRSVSLCMRLMCCSIVTLPTWDAVGDEGGGGGGGASSTAGGSLCCIRVVIWMHS